MSGFIVGLHCMLPDSAQGALGRGNLSYLLVYGRKAHAEYQLTFSCTPGKVVVDDPRFPAFPESAEEAHARINAVLEVSSSKQGHCKPVLITTCLDVALTVAAQHAGHWQPISGKHLGCSSWRGARLFQHPKFKLTCRQPKCLIFLAPEPLMQLSHHHAGHQQIYCPSDAMDGCH